MGRITFKDLLDDPTLLSKYPGLKKISSIRIAELVIKHPSALDKVPKSRITPRDKVKILTRHPHLLPKLKTKFEDIQRLLENNAKLAPEYLIPHLKNYRYAKVILLHYPELVRHTEPLTLARMSFLPGDLNEDLLHPSVVEEIVSAKLTHTEKTLEPYYVPSFTVNDKNYFLAAHPELTLQYPDWIKEQYDNGWIPVPLINKIYAQIDLPKYLNRYPENTCYLEPKVKNLIVNNLSNYSDDVAYNLLLDRPRREIHPYSEWKVTLNGDIPPLNEIPDTTAIGLPPKIASLVDYLLKIKTRISKPK